MKKYLLFFRNSFFALLTPVLFFTACSQQQGCLLNGHTMFGEYRKALLLKADGTVVDSMELTDGAFSFRQNNTVPSAMLVRLQLEKDDPIERLEMPFFTENGVVRMEIGEYIDISGTPLNNALNQFFDLLQQTKDALNAKEGVTVKEIKSTYSTFYKQQILFNRDNALGHYIYQAYSVNLTAEDRAEVEEAIQ